MSTVAPAVEPAAPARTSGLSAIFEHSRYVLAENRVTAFAFGLLIVIVLAALFGPYIVPHDPLASDTAAALKPPSLAHWFGTDQLGRDIFSRVIVATRLDTFIAVASVVLVFLMGDSDSSCLDCRGVIAVSAIFIWRSCAESSHLWRARHSSKALMSAIDANA